MRKQCFTLWEPLDGLPSTLYLEALHDDYEGLRIVLATANRAAPFLRLVFDSVVAYRNINESYRLATWMATQDRRPHASLLRVTNSEWVDWLIRESGGVLSRDTLTHYAIYTPEDCVDIVTQFKPTVEWIG